MKHITLLPLLFILWGCATTQPAVIEEPPETPAPADYMSMRENYRFHTFTELLKVVDESSISYEIKLAEEAQTLLLPYGLEIRNLSAYTYLEEDGSLSIIELTPEEEELYSKAEGFIKSKDYESLKQLYRKALEIRETNPKTWTNLGDSYYMAGEYNEAILLFSKALELNPVDYQAYWFLADSYLASGEKQKALTSIAVAYILNPAYQPLHYSLETILEANGLKRDEKWFFFPFEVQKIDDSKCEIKVQTMEWLPMALVSAVWLMEEPFISINQTFADESSFNLLFIEEALHVQHSTINEEEGVSPKLEKLGKVIDQGYLEEMILMEVVARVYPRYLARMDEETLSRVYQYLMGFVFLKE